MVKSKEEFPVQEYTPCCGGTGTTLVTDFLTSRQMYAHPKTVAHALMKEGDSIGWHVHVDEMEVYVILNGEGLFNDNGKEVKVKSLDVTITLAGEGHAIRPVKGSSLELLALIFEK